MSGERAREIVGSADFALPRPGSGRTLERFAALTRLCTEDIGTGRLVEAHADADAILGEIVGGGVAPGEFWGVWAAEPPRPRVDARLVDARWQLSGVKPWCSGATVCTHALVTAHTDAGIRLFAVDLRAPGVSADTSGWHSPGMLTTDTGDVAFDAVPAEPVGGVGAYLDRPGFWHGGIGVAACWFGGARRVARPLYRAVADSDDPILRMHAGAVDARLTAGWAQLEAAARQLDAAPHAPAARLAFAVRWSIEQVATGIIDRVGRALGPRPLVADPDHAHAVADLTVYIRQSHADADLVTLGGLVDGRIPGPEGDR
ncbi:acyl-CoA dehydrogenase family protein [Gordonia paraffinivorans]|uniref:acyl-CoA dehydrogenase family protein n=1 Tax=Gordonia paraffinivorans TaxID=175628 RepID=UPI001E393179|nr:acyl-CoA dehydrogenase family protein [Gordonia paraffinivorans]MCD2146908.1 acyl-CoA dehydrogenase family protein [Gordonia paraffinivorans]